MTRNFRAEATEFEAPSASQLIASVLTLISDDVRQAAAADIETAFRLRTEKLTEVIQDIVNAGNSTRLMRIQQARELLSHLTKGST